MNTKRKSKIFYKKRRITLASYLVFDYYKHMPSNNANGEEIERGGKMVVKKLHLITNYTRIPKAPLMEKMFNPWSDWF